MKEFDVVVIGAGPGGYVAAIRCAQLGLRTACVERWRDPRGKPALGGTCLNVGCIPSKALLDTSHHYHNLTHLLPAHGIGVEGTSIDVPAMQARKDKLVTTLTRGIAGLFRKNRIEWFQGTGALRPGRRVEVRAPGREAVEVLEARHIVVATGSAPIDIPAARTDGERIVDSEGALVFTEVPRRLGVIGAGVIGLELGSVWARLGAKVILLEALDDFLAAADREIADAALKSFSTQGIDIRLGTRVTGSELTRNGVRVTCREGGKDEDSIFDFDRLVVAVGRRAVTEGLEPEAVGLRLDAAGRIEVDALCRTSADGIYAIGDAVAGPMLAHKASEEGVAVAEHIAGEAAHIDHALVPFVIYTHPEVAWVGSTPAELEATGTAFRTGTFPYLALGRARGAGDTEGMVKVLGDAATDRLLGVHIFGAQASELIAEAVTAMAFHASTEDLARIVHAHPTLSESLHEAALAVDDRAIHI